MRLHYIVTLPLLCAATVADPGSDSGSGPGSDNAGHGVDVVYLPVESLQHQLLNTTGLVPDSLVAVTASYGALKDESPGLAGVTAPNTTAYASVLIVPAENFAATTTAATGKQEATSVDELSGRTQLMYNCTSAPNLWNMQEDPDVLRLVNFQQFSSNVSNGTSTSSSKTEVPRKIVAIASVEVSYCATVQKTAVGRPVLVNAFFAEEFNDTPIFYYTTNSSSLRSDTDTSASGSCVIRLDMAQANFSEVYPNCKITFQSTDLDNIIHLDEVPSSSVETNKTRRLDLDSFGFVEDPACTSGCGEGGAAPDQCWVDGTTTALCQLQFYGRNADCDYECGNKVGNLAMLPADQCYDCYTELLFDCKYGYLPTGGGNCCTVLSCEPIDDTSMTNPKGLTWNLQSDGQTIINPSYVIYQEGDCSDLTDFSSDCCRITCEDCFVTISIASLYADINTYGLGDYTTSSEMKLVGGSYLRVKVFAPSGCDIEDVHNTIDDTVTLHLYSGINLELQVQLDILRRLSLKPHGTSVEFGSYINVEGVTAGDLNSEPFVDAQITSTPANAVAQSGIDIELEVAAIPTVRASLLLLGGTATIGVKASCAISTELKAGIEFPEPYPALSSKYLDADSFFHYGDCSLPHFMEFAGYAGIKNITVSLPMSLNIPLIIKKSYEPMVNGGSLTMSIFSGCISTAYEAEMLLSTAIDAVSSLSPDKQQKLKEIVMWLLGISEIDPDFLTLDSVSAATGEISIRIAVPPSVAESYPTASDLQSVIYQRARTASFSNAVSAYVGLDVNAQCDAGSWGQNCENSCDHGHCGDVNCNPVDGVAISCSYCDSGYWGPICEERCDLPTHCITAWCQQDSATASGCWSCEDGWEGGFCEITTSSGSSTSTDTSSSTSSGSTKSTPTPTTNANTGGQTGSARKWAPQGPLLWFQIFTPAFGWIWLF